MIQLNLAQIKEQVNSVSFFPEMLEEDSNRLKELFLKTKKIDSVKMLCKHLSHERYWDKKGAFGHYLRARYSCRIFAIFKKKCRRYFK